MTYKDQCEKYEKEGEELNKRDLLTYGREGLEPPEELDEYACFEGPDSPFDVIGGL